jgi:predicted secreted hydrolase
MIRMLRPFLLLLLAALAFPCRAAAPVFAPVTPGRPLAFPADFGAHPDFRTEWWYVTGWVQGRDGKPLGFQVTFFRSRTESDTANPSAFAPKQLVFGHAALSDPAVGHLVHDQRAARAGFGLAYANIGNTDVRLDDWRMRRLPDGSYEAVVRGTQLSFTLRLAPTQPPLLQGDAGYSKKGPGALDASYYYSEPHLRVTGEVARAGQSATQVTGTAWLDHEWSTQYLGGNATGWDWTGLNFDDGASLMAFRIRRKDGATLWSHATLRDAAGRLTQYGGDAVRFAPLQNWTSPRTGASYPVALDLTAGATRYRLTPLQPDQELDSRASVGAVYWEGAMSVTRDGKPVGRGYLELTGYASALKLH